MLEMQDVFQKFSAKYQETHSINIQCYKAINSISNCRTLSLGGHVEVCENGDNQKISYNSCGNRNCPKCGNIKKEEWILNRQADLLPVQYFHTVFTVPHSLNPLFLSNQVLLYNLLFKAVSQTSIKLALDPKLMGAQIGVTTVLHTWGQNLSYHPHIHCIIPGGGLSESGHQFVKAKDKFFIPVKILSKVFKNKFLASLKEAYVEKKLEFHGESQSLSTNEGFYGLIDTLYKTDWVVYCKKPFKTSDSVIEYLSRYTHKTAIYNNRLVSMDDTNISFRWRDYADNNKSKLMTLDAMEFIRRFLIHVLPSGFQKIRHYGLLSNRNRKTKLARCFKLLKLPIKQRFKLSAKELILKVHGLDISVCPKCGGHWVTTKTMYPLRQ